MRKRLQGYDWLRRTSKKRSMHVLWWIEGLVLVSMVCVLFYHMGLGLMYVALWVLIWTSVFPPGQELVNCKPGIWNVHCYTIQLQCKDQVGYVLVKPTRYYQSYRCLPWWHYVAKMKVGKTCVLQVRVAARLWKESYWLSHAMIGLSKVSDCRYHWQIDRAQ